VDQPVGGGACARSTPVLPITLHSWQADFGSIIDRPDFGITQRGCGDRAHGASSLPLRGSSRRTAIRVSPRSRTLASSPCSAGWSVSRPEMTVSSLWPLTCRPSNQAAHRLSRTPATRISYHAGPPEALTLSPEPLVYAAAASAAA